MPLFSHDFFSFLLNYSIHSLIPVFFKRFQAPLFHFLATLITLQLAHRGMMIIQVLRGYSFGIKPPMNNLVRKFMTVRQMLNYRPKVKPEESKGLLIVDNFAILS